MEFGWVVYCPPSGGATNIRDATIPDTANTKDRVVWGLSPNGVFTTASVYRFLISKNDEEDTPEVKKEFTSIWRAHIPNKIKHFLWLLLHNIIKTNHMLHSLGKNANLSCPTCGHHKEDITHIFFKCHIATDFWREVNLNGWLRNTIDSSTLDSTSWMDCWKKIKGSY